MTARHVWLGPLQSAANWNCVPLSVSRRFKHTGYTLTGQNKTYAVVHFGTHTINSSAKCVQCIIGCFGHWSGPPLHPPWSVSTELNQTPNGILLYRPSKETRDWNRKGGAEGGGGCGCACVRSVNADCTLAEETQTTGTSAPSRCLSAPVDRRTPDRLTGEKESFYLSKRRAGRQPVPTADTRVLHAH